METIDDIIQQGENDIYSEFIAIAKKFSYLKESSPYLYRPKVIGEMTIVAELAKQSEIIRNFFIRIDRDPEVVIDNLLHKAIATL